MSLSSTMSDIKPAPGRKDGQNEMAGPSGSPSSFDTPFKDGFTDFHKASQLLSVTTEVKLPHGAPKMDSPFQGDFRPGVNSSKPE